MCYVYVRKIENAYVKKVEMSCVKMPNQFLGCWNLGCKIMGKKLKVL